MLGDVLGTWIAPAVFVFMGIFVTVLVSAFQSRSREKRAAEAKALDEANRKKREAEESRDRLLETFKDQLGEVHGALLGEDPSPFNPHPPPGVLEQLGNLNAAVYDEKSGILSRLGRLENKP